MLSSSSSLPLLAIINIPCSAVSLRQLSYLEVESLQVVELFVLYLFRKFGEQVLRVDLTYEAS